MKDDNKSTLSVHAGQQRDSNIGVVNPIEPAVAFHYIDSGNQYYPRYFNTPNQQYIVEKIAALEHAPTGMLFSSGLAAISTTMRALAKPGDHVVMMENLYGGSLSFAAKEFSELGIAYDLAGSTVEEIMESTRPETTVILVETPANPLMQIIDLQALATAAKAKGILTVVDNTFASPINQNPADFGIDLVIHSGTKYLGGHSDLQFGTVTGSHELVERIRQKGICYGGNLDAMSCYLIERSIKTLDVRVSRQNENALEIAKFLDKHDSIAKVYYAGLPTHPGFEIAQSQMRGFGGMLAFDLAAQHSATHFLRHLKLISPAMSLGGIETTVTLPVHSSHGLVPPAERQRLGIGEQLVRLSTGIENIEDILSDIEQALRTSVEKPAALQTS
ncbi:MAG: PLP-dependent aspartate aminotransferase family protein [Pirellulaceae bacterium]|nr:PLP-dependent aspartate aminotransferase family protein [Pirellulaceae bacterium]MDG2102160.1 PLP-dependent aspartate aminotransferase family protein [Pirellulaceae bacterium]